MAGNVARLALAGALGVPRYPEIRAAFESAPAGVPVLIDLREAATVDPTFLAELLLFQRRRLPAKVAVVIPADGEVARVFGLPAMRGKIAAFPGEADALAALSGEREAGA